MTFLVVNIFRALEIFLYCSYVTSRRHISHRPRRLPPWVTATGRDVGLCL
jgi:hypothetical protein